MPPFLLLPPPARSFRPPRLPTPESIAASEGLYTHGLYRYPLNTLQNNGALRPPAVLANGPGDWQAVTAWSVTVNCDTVWPAQSSCGTEWSLWYDESYDKRRSFPGLAEGRADKGCVSLTRYGMGPSGSAPRARPGSVTADCR
jgi:hypothetical protein